MLLQARSRGPETALQHPSCRELRRTAPACLAWPWPGSSRVSHSAGHTEGLQVNAERTVNECRIGRSAPPRWRLAQLRSPEPALGGRMVAVVKREMGFGLRPSTAACGPGALLTCAVGIKAAPRGSR